MAHDIRGPWQGWTRLPVTGGVMSAQMVDFDPPAGLVYIPAGVFTMGNCMEPSEGQNDELPLHDVYVSAFYMGQYEVTKSEWDATYQWALTNGYGFDNAGCWNNGTNYSRGDNHPVHYVNWYDVVKWCNARSEREGLTTCYTSSGATYRAGWDSNVVCNWTANGYRLPTEAEWEKAARGGVVDGRFPWTETNTVSHAQANYCCLGTNGTYYTYDVSLTAGYHPLYLVNEGEPYTSPVGSFAPNGYGLYDMAGNVWESCWDWYGNDWYTNSSATATDTHGPAAGSYRMAHGGSWYTRAWSVRVAFRSYGLLGSKSFNLGLRPARSASL